MAERNPAVLERIQSELRNAPSASVKDLQAAGSEVDRNVSKLSLRQFNARYVLPLKRKKGTGKRNKGAGKATQRMARGSGGTRDAVRNVLLEFARDLSAAESRSSVVAVISDIDSYVDRALAATK